MSCKVLWAALAAAMIHGLAHAGDARFGYCAYSGKSQESALVKPTASQFINPVISGHAPDPSIERVGDDYYMVTSS